MRIRFVTVAVALVSLFASQQAFAKNHTKTANKTAAANKKHHKKHTKKAGVASTAFRAA